MRNPKNFTEIHNLVAGALMPAKTDIGVDREGEDFFITARGKKYRLKIEPVLTLREILQQLVLYSNRVFIFEIQGFVGFSKLENLDDAEYLYVGVDTFYELSMSSEVTAIDKNILTFADGTKLSIYERLPVDLS